MNERLIFILAMLVGGGFFALSSAMLFMKGGLPPESKEPILLILGAWISCFTTVIGYFFGSSQGSKDKSDAINRMVK